MDGGGQEHCGKEECETEPGSDEHHARQTATLQFTLGGEECAVAANPIRHLASLLSR